MIFIILMPMSTFAANIIKAVRAGGEMSANEIL